MEIWPVNRAMITGRGMYSQPKYILFFHLAPSLAFHTPSSLPLLPPSCSLIFTWSLPLSETKWEVRVQESSGDASTELSLLGINHHAEEQRISLEGQVEDNQYKTPSCFLWILLFAQFICCI